MNITTHNLTDEDFSKQSRRLSNYIKKNYPKAVFTIKSSKKELSEEYAPNQFLVARDPDPVGHMSIFNFSISQDSPIHWLYQLSAYHLYNENGLPIQHEQLQDFEPLNKTSSNGSYVLSLESFQAGVGSSLINKLKYMNDYIILNSRSNSKAFYEKLGFEESRFQLKEKEVLKPFFYWSR